MTIAQTQLSNAKVSLLYDSNFSPVDPATEAAPGMQAFAWRRPGTPSPPFAGTTTEDWRNATNGADVLVIPEAGRSEPEPSPYLPGRCSSSRTSSAKAARLILVSGTRQSNSSGTDLINTVFGTALVELADVGHLDAHCRHQRQRPSAQTSPLLVNNGSTDALQAASLPAFAKSLYETAARRFDGCRPSVRQGTDRLARLGLVPSQAAARRAGRRLARHPETIGRRHRLRAERSDHRRYPRQGQGRLSTRLQRPSPRATATT